MNLVWLEDFLGPFYCLFPKLNEIPMEWNVSPLPRTFSRLDVFILEKTAA